MAQKDKVKELVGRGLDSYHTKSLQQIDRIEKKNKQQNHKISILSNELDNDYLTKTEEGSVISLEHSKEGMVYIDSLEGNTLVNYCTDGAKELTLNGDIDLEGTFVNTTEGVDNGKVDVYCEGNTLVNIANDKTVSGTRRNGNIIITPTKLYSQFSVTHSELMSKLNTTYTIRIEVLNNTSTVPLVANKYNGTFNGWNGIEVGFTGEKIFTYTTGSEYQFSRWFWVENNVVGEGEIEIRLTILEGDWTDKEIPPYFEGMKSVGQDDENGHKIEILSQNKNLCTVSSYSGVCHNKIESNIPCKKNTVYTLTFKDESDLNQSGNRGITLITHKTKTDKSDHGSIYTYAMNEGGKEYTFRKSGFTFNTSDCCYISLTSNNMSSVPNLIIKEIQIEEGSQTSYSPQMFNKKEILINEPLRGLPNGTKDRKVKIGGKWYIERNCGEVTIVEDALTTKIWGDDGNKRYVFVSNALPNMKTNSYIYTDKIPYTGSYTSSKYFGTRSTVVMIFCFPQEIETIEEKKELVRPYLQNGGLKVVYELATPTYEPLEINPELICYNDTTHISNNSLIPCNMKVKNSGYNAIIKPSTLYTIALDTNKSGTIGMNLGGVKGITANNVLTLTTPATLTDDSLRLYGKGIKGSKVRLLEGDKTNWIPSFFEGMKSCFEDKFDTTDNTYKMEILSNNKNLFDNTKIPDYTGGDMKYYFGYGGRFKRIENKEYILGNYGGMAFILNLPKNKTYKISIKVRNSNGSNTKVQSAIFLNKEVIGHTNSTFTTNVTENVIGFGVVNYNENTDLILYDTILSEVIDEYTERNCNKIQFSSIEPLRGVGDVKDRFVFKDNKLMIERNCQVTILDGNNELWTYEQMYGSIYNNKMLFLIKDKTTSNFNPNTNGDYHSDRLNRINGLTEYYNEGFILREDKVIGLVIESHRFNNVYTTTKLREWLSKNPLTIVYQLTEPTYEEIPFELQKIILEGYENGTLFFDTNIPPTITVTYAGETPIVKATKLNKTEVLNNTTDINDNIIPYLMDMDYRVVCLELATETQGISMARLFGGVYEMLKRDILSRRYSVDEYRHRLDAYLGANKITEEEYNKLGDMLNE